MKINNGYFFFIIFISIYLVSFYLKIDVIKGAVPDLQTHWKYIQKLTNVGLLNILDIKLGNKTLNGLDSKLLNFPLHHIIVSQIPIINKNLNAYLNIFFFISIIIPYLFYRCCVERFKDIDKKKLFFFSSILYILPNFQAASIWGNNHNTAIIFFLIALFYLIKIEQAEKKNNFYIILTYLFLFLASYTKQYYVIFFPIFFFKILIKFKFEFKIIYLSTITCLILSIPGGIFLYNNLGLMQNLSIGATNFSSSVVVVSTIISFYLIPFLLIEIINKNFDFKKTLKNKRFIISFITILIFTIYSSFNFIYDTQIGGGFFIKLNNLLFDNYFNYIILSILLSAIVMYFSRNHLMDNFTTLTLLISFSSGWFIFQKYFEPMYLIMFVLLYDKKMLKGFFKNKLDYLYLYFLIYWVLYFIFKENDKFVSFFKI